MNEIHRIISETETSQEKLSRIVSKILLQIPFLRRASLSHSVEAEEQQDEKVGRLKVDLLLGVNLR